MSKSTNPLSSGRILLATAVASALLTACATAPMKPAGAADARAKLTELQSDPTLANLAPAAMADAQVAVRTAEIPETNQALVDHRVYMADRKVGIAKAQAQTRFAENQRATITAERASVRLDARTREADIAESRAATARAGERTQRLAADQAQSEASAATLQAAASAQQAAEMQRQIDKLQAKVTDRGLVLTLGDVLFTSGRADLKAGAANNLNRLVAFLNRYPSRTALIEGHTDSVGTQGFNQGLSERRAQAVQAYLREQGIDAARLDAVGKGEAGPVAGNDSAAGRQQNRRVEVIINDPKIASN